MATTLFPLQYLRQGADPIDVDSVFATTAERIAYLSNGRRYPGQIVADLEENKVYFLDSAGTSWIEVGSGGGGIPGGLDGQVQYNDGGVFGGSPSFTYDSATSTVGLEKISNPGPITVEVTSTPAWYSLYGDLVADVDDDYSSSVVYDSLGNIYSIGADGNTGVPFLLKYSPSGTLLWQKTFTEVNNYYKTGDALTVDSLDNVYCSISVDDAAVESYIIKLDSSGNIVWQLKLQNFNGTDYTIPPVTDMMVDGSDNLYALVGVRKLPSSWLSDTVLIKFSSGGVLQWQRKLSTPGVDDSLYPQGIWVDSAGNSHIVMTYTVNSLPYPVTTVVAKYTTGGVLDWQNEYDIAPLQNDYAYNITGDSVGNIYFTLQSNDLNIIKADSAGSIIWNKQIDSGTNSYPSGVALDASGNVYVSGGFFAGFPSPRNDYLILKYTSAGSLVWQRSFSGSDSDYMYYYWASRNIDVLGENYVISGYTYSPALNNSEAIVVQLKTDGSGTGVYGSFTYGIPTFTESTPVITVQASTLTATVAGLTISAGSLVAADLTKTATYTYMFGGTQAWSFNTDGSLSLPGYSIPGADGVAGSLLQTDGAGTADWTPYGLPLVDGAAGETLVTDGAGNVSWTQINVNPGGSDTQVQYNDGGILGGNSALTFNKVTGTLQSTNTTVTDTLTVPYITNSDNITITLGGPLPLPEAGVNPWFKLTCRSQFYAYSIPKRIKYGSDGSIYVVSFLNTNSGDDIVQKYNRYTGEVIWQVEPVDSEYVNDMEIMGNSIYLISRWTVVSLSTSTGALQWRLYFDVGSYDYCRLAGDGTNIYVKFGDVIYKISTTGSIIWKKQIPTILYLSSMVADSSGNIFLSGYYNYTDLTLIKIDSAGNIEWQYRYTGLDPTEVTYIRLDSSGNIYVLVHNGSVTQPTVLVKFNSSGTYQWAYTTVANSNVELGSTPAHPLGLAIDYNGLIYILMAAYQRGNDYSWDSTAVLCMNPSGSLLWQKSLVSNDGAIYQSDYEYCGDLIDVLASPPQEFAVAVRSLGATLGNPIVGYDAVIVARFPASQTGLGSEIENSGLRYIDNYYNLVSKPLVQVVTTESLTTPTYGATLFSGVSLTNNYPTWLATFGYYSWIYYTTGLTQIGSSYMLPSAAGDFGTVLRYAGQGGTTEWATPAIVSRDASYTWTGKQTFSGGVVVNNLIKPTEILVISLSGTTNATFNTSIYGAQYYTTAASGNWSVAFSSINGLEINDSVTYEIYVTQGASGYYNKDVWINNSIVTDISWFTDRPLAGNPNSVDKYVYNITKISTTAYRIYAGRYKYLPNTLPYPYWVSRLSGDGGNGYSLMVGAVTVDSSGNVYAASVSSAGTSRKYVSKFDNNGILLWTTAILGGAASSPADYEITVDGSGNVYSIADSGSGIFHIVKLNSSGVLQWQQQVIGGSSNAVVVGTSLYIAVAQFSGTTRQYILSFDTTSGTINWQRELSVAAGIGSIGADSSGNIYLGGTNTIFKINSSGTILWQKFYANNPIYRMCVTPSGNVATVSSAQRIQLINGLTGVPIWASQITSNFSTTSGSKIAADSSDNIYVLADYGPFIKLSSSGTLLWNNRINTPYWCQGLAVSATGIVYIGIWYSTSYANGPSQILKMPTDGSGLNVYRFSTGPIGIFSISRQTSGSSTISAAESNQSYVLSASAITSTATTYTIEEKTVTNSIMEVIPTSNQ